MANLITDRQWLEGLAKMEMNEELMAKTLHKLEVLKKNSSNKSAENAPLLERAQALVTEKGNTYASEVGEIMDITVQKASYLLKSLENQGILKSVYGAPIEGKPPVKIYSLI